MPRPPSANSIIRNMKQSGQQFEPKTPIASNMFLPNHSGVNTHRDIVNNYLTITDAASTYLKLDCSNDPLLSSLMVYHEIDDMASVHIYNPHEDGTAAVILGNGGGMTQYYYVLMSTNDGGLPNWLVRQYLGTGSVLEANELGSWHWYQGTLGSTMTQRMTLTSTAGDLSISGGLTTSGNHSYFGSYGSALANPHATTMQSILIGKTAYIAGQSTERMRISSNAYWSSSSTWKRITTGEAFLMDITGGSLTFYTGSGSAGADTNITFSNSVTIADDGEIRMPNATATGQGILLGGDVEMFRGAADYLDLGTSDNLRINTGYVYFTSGGNPIGYIGTLTGGERLTFYVWNGAAAYACALRLNDDRVEMRSCYAIDTASNFDFGLGGNQDYPAVRFGASSGNCEFYYGIDDGSGDYDSEFKVRYIADDNVKYTRLVIDKNGMMTFGGDGNAADDSGLPYGSFYGNHIGWSQANAVQNTWYNISDADISDGELMNVEHDGNGKLGIATAGRYLINYSVCFEDDVANDHIETGIEVSGSGSAVSPGQGHSENKFASEEEHLSGTLILDLAVEDTLEIAIRTTDNNTPTISVQSVNMTVVLIGGT